jgi:EAL domain-containing protein (putative c-di-GMP-specific phosphodiesterase class I)
MPIPALEKYLGGLHNASHQGAVVSLDASGCAQGRYFKSTLTSAFQPIRELDSGRVLGFEGLARSYSATDQGLCVWKLLDHAASDLESIELDRLCRMLHAINFFRQPEAQDADLFVSVHARLLAAVEGNHGDAFRRILESLALSHRRIVLQLPAVTHNQNWVLNSVSENYRNNGFRFAVNANSVREALVLLDHVRPDVIKLDARQLTDHGAALELLVEASARETPIIFKRLESAAKLSALRRIGQELRHPIHAQGFLWDLPQALLGAAAGSGSLFRASSSITLRQSEA